MEQYNETNNNKRCMSQAIALCPSMLSDVIGIWIFCVGDVKIVVFYEMPCKTWEWAVVILFLKLKPILRIDDDSKLAVMQ